MLFIVLVEVPLAIFFQYLSFSCAQVYLRIKYEKPLLDLHFMIIALVPLQGMFWRSKY